jgi:hypothetical protein
MRTPVAHPAGGVDLAGTPQTAAQNADPWSSLSAAAKLKPRPAPPLTLPAAHG